MKPNKKYVMSDGTQYCMYPNQFMNITQSIFGSYSHKGAYAIDDAQQNTGIQNGYAPCDVKCVAIDRTYHFVMWESVRPVQTRKYGKTYVHFYVGHDNVLNAYVGMVIPQGTQLFSEGTGGNATGNHNHFEIGLGKYDGIFWTPNAYNVYVIRNGVNPADVWFVDDTTIINGGGLDWKKTNSVTPTPTPSPTPTPTPSKETWYDGACYVGCTVKSVDCGIQGISGANVRVNALGGLVPLVDVHEGASSKDGNPNDDFLATTLATVYLSPCKVTAVDAVNNLVQIQGAGSGARYWINPTPLRIKK